MPVSAKATRIDLRNFHTPQMRAFHVSWIAFFLCFFAWFGIAPLMPVIRAELHLSQEQVGWSIIASVAFTIFARLGVGELCDRFGPRRTYTWLLVVSALPVMGIGLSHDFNTFLLFRLLIGGIGASFVITQYHTSVMFAANCVGTANATAAGWGNLGGGMTQAGMSGLYALLVGTMGLSAAAGWRVAMLIAGALCLVAAVAYWRLTQDTPEGDLVDLRASGRLPPFQKKQSTFLHACRDGRVWALAAMYGACFGIELTLNNVAALYFTDHFHVGLMGAGLLGTVHGGLNLFSRPLGGMASDRIAVRHGLNGRVLLLLAALLLEGLGLLWFSQVGWLPLAVVALATFALFSQMACGATYAIVPFVNRRGVGSVSGIVGAGGNVGAVMAGFLFKSSLGWSSSLLILGLAVTTVAFLALAVRFPQEAELEAGRELHARLGELALEPAN